MIVFGEKLVTKKSVFSRKSIDKLGKIVYIIIIKGKYRANRQKGNSNDAETDFCNHGE